MMVIDEKRTKQNLRTIILDDFIEITFDDISTLLIVTKRRRKRRKKPEKSHVE